MCSCTWSLRAGLKDSVVRCAANRSSAWRKGAKVRREVDLSLDVHRVSAWWRTVVVRFKCHTVI